MLSVLVPTYCWNSFPLIKKLHFQLVREQIPFEIIVIDDASNDESYLNNQKSEQLSNTSFEVLNKNIGRSAVRNLLAAKASYSWLLFLDADVMIDDDNFIRRYIRHIKYHNSDAVIGGTVYKRSKKSLLRLKFGKKREEVSLKQRVTTPLRYFFTANFLIKKRVFELVTFNENLQGYGYEDLLFAIDTQRFDFSISHVNNPVLHLKIDSNDVFIRNTKEGLSNLAYLIKSEQLPSGTIKIICILKKYRRIINLLTPLYSLFEKLANRTSSLVFFDLFRITYLAKILKKMQ